MNRYRVLIVTLAAMALIAGCTSSDDTADETTSEPPATTVAPAATVAATATTTTEATTTSTTLSPAAAIATVEAFIDARNAHDADAFAAFLAESALTAEGDGKTSHSWERSLVAFDELVGWQGTLSGCETDDGVVTCLVTSEDTLVSGKAGVVYTFEYEFRFDAQGLIEYGRAEVLTGDDEYSAFDDAFGLWMMNAYPESFSTFYLVDADSEAWQERIEQTGKPYWRKENWFTPEGVAELSPLVDKFVAQSDDYPLSPSVSAATSSAVSGEVPRLTFDGESCTYEGPTELTAGPVAIDFVNLMEDPAEEAWRLAFKVNLMRHKGDETVQDMVDYIGPEPSTGHQPSWVSNPQPAPWDYPAVFPSQTVNWEGNLEPGTYTMICALFDPFGVWFGTGLTVEE